MALSEAALRLGEVPETPRLDAELLLAHALGITREQLLLGEPRPVPGAFRELLDRRLAGEPLAYITGARAFWTIEVEVGPGVLVPRPDSETLLEAAVAHFRGTAGPHRILDLGTGPGTLLLAALDQWPAASGLGIDCSENALGFARRNARGLGLDARAEWRLGDWADGVTGRFDLILCNPPYVADDAELGTGVREHEPAEALFAGPEGLDDLARLACQLPPLLAPGGLAAVEIGADQGRSAPLLFARSGADMQLARDLAGRPRALLLTCV